MRCSIAEKLCKVHESGSISYLFILSVSKFVRYNQGIHIQRLDFCFCRCLPRSDFCRFKLSRKDLNIELPVQLITLPHTPQMGSIRILLCGADSPFRAFVMQLFEVMVKSPHTIYITGSRLTCLIQNFLQKYSLFQAHSPRPGG